VDRLPHDATWSDLANYAMERQDMEENGVDGESNRIAEEVLEEYDQIQAEVERSLARESMENS
jgi:hypothetical protein